jgi:hypothetical protein
MNAVFYRIKQEPGNEDEAGCSNKDGAAIVVCPVPGTNAQTCLASFDLSGKFFETLHNSNNSFN